MYRILEFIIIGFVAMAVCALLGLLFVTPLIANPTSPANYVVARAFELIGLMTICYWIGKFLTVWYKAAVRREAKRYTSRMAGTTHVLRQPDHRK
jgi:hypothetical protein